MQPLPAWILSLSAALHVAAPSGDPLAPAFPGEPTPARDAPAAPPVPLACALQAGGRDAQVAALRELRDQSRNVVDLPDGYAFVFADDAGAAALLRVVLAERRCCPFFRFEILLPPDLGPVTLRVTGPAAAKPFIRELLGGG